MEQNNNNQNNQNGGWNSPIPPQPPNPYDLERRIALLEQSADTIKSELNKINSNINKLVWIVMSAVILAGLNIIFNGAGGV